MEQICRNLLAAIFYQACKDYFAATKEEQKVIIKELRLFGGRGEVVAEQLLLHPDEIEARIKYQEEE